MVEPLQTSKLMAHEIDADNVASECSWFRYGMEAINEMTPDAQRAWLSTLGRCNAGYATALQWLQPGNDEEESQLRTRFDGARSDAPPPCRHVHDGFGWSGCDACMHWRSESSPLGIAVAGIRPPVSAGDHDLPTGRDRTEPDPLDMAATDLAAAHRMLRTRGSDIRHCGPLRAWLIWDGCRWRADDQHQIERIAGECARAYTIFCCKNDASVLNAAKKMEARSRITGAIAQARSLLPLVVEVDHLDANPDILVCRNGTIDLRTGELLPHRREDLATHFVDVDYDPTARAPRFEQFLSEIHPRQPKITDFLQRWLGYSLTGHTREQALVMAVGEGRNGKGVLFELWGRLLGHELAAPAPRGLLMTARGDRHPTELMALRGRRYVYASEVDGGITFSEERLKWLTGSDTISARACGKDFVEFSPTHKLVLYVNEKPQVNDTSQGFWARMRVLEFEQTFEGDACDPALHEKLDAEIGGVLAWGVRGAIRWYEEGLPVPVAVAAATAEYRDEEDDVGRWLAGLLDEGAYLEEELASRLLASYSTWAEANSGREHSHRSFSIQLKRHGCVSRRAHGGTVYRLPPKATAPDCMSQFVAVDPEETLTRALSRRPPKCCNHLQPATEDGLIPLLMEAPVRAHEEDTCTP